MKGYKFLLPIILIALFVFSSYTMFSKARQQYSSYMESVDKARVAAKQGILLDAANFYQNALKINDNIDLCLEVGNMFVTNKLPKDAIAWGKTIINKYPNDERGYVFLLEQYIEVENYKECFKTYRLWESRKKQSQSINEIIEKIAYVYSIDYKSFTQVGVFSEGYAPVKNKNSWGYINTKGRLTLKYAFKEAGPFGSERAAVISEEGELYYIDVEGNKKHIMPEKTKVLHAGVLLNNVATLETDKGYVIYNYNEKENIFVPSKQAYPYASTINLGVGVVDTGKGWKIINAKGEPISAETYLGFVIDEKEIAFRNERLFAKTKAGYVMLDEKGAQVNKTVYEDAKVFMEDGYAAVKQNGKWGFVDKSGTIIIPPKYDDAHSFSGKLAAVKVDGLWGFINEKNKLVIPAKFEDVKDFNKSGNVFIFEENSWKLLSLYNTDM